MSFNYENQILEHNAEYDHIKLNIGDVVKVFDYKNVDLLSGEPIVCLGRVVNIFSQTINGDTYNYYVIKCFDEEMNELYDANICDTKFMAIIASSEQLKMIPYIPSPDDSKKKMIGYSEFIEYTTGRTE